MCSRVKAFIPGHQNRCRCMYSFIIRLHVIIFFRFSEWKDVTDRDILEKENINSLLPCIFHICCNYNYKVSKLNGFCDLRQKFPLILAIADHCSIFGWL